MAGLTVDGSVKYYIRAECGQEDRIGPLLGPFDSFIQLTYAELRVGPEGYVVAQYSVNRRCWLFVQDEEGFVAPITDTGDLPHDENWKQQEWSDVIIFAGKPEDAPQAVPAERSRAIQLRGEDDQYGGDPEAV